MKPIKSTDLLLDNRYIIRHKKHTTVMKIKVLELTKTSIYFDVEGGDKVRLQYKQFDYIYKVLEGLDNE